MPTPRFATPECRERFLARPHVARTAAIVRTELTAAKNPARIEMLRAELRAVERAEEITERQKAHLRLVELRGAIVSAKAEMLRHSIPPEWARTVIGEALRLQNIARGVEPPIADAMPAPRERF